MKTSTASECHFIVRLFSEISIKSPPVRKRWTKHLADNIRVMLRRIHPKASVTRDWDKLDVRIPTDAHLYRKQVMEILRHTPGIANFSEVTPHPFTTIHDVYEKTLAVWHDVLAERTFCVRVKRTGHHDFTSTEAERYIGGGLNQNTQATGVKLKSPDVTVNIVIKDNQFFLVNEIHQGLGGFPIGSQDPVLSLVSGGFDSTVASYMMIKRGLRTHYCFFNLGGRAHEVGVKEIAYYLWQKYGSSHRVKFITVPFEAVVGEILENINPSNMGVVLKRMMIQAANQIADNMKITALVTGEAVSQVSSQTIPNLNVIDEVSNSLVLRPLIVMDKTDIIRTARDIGAESFSANIPEYCGVISVKPSAKVNRKKLLAEELLMDSNVLQEAISNIQIQPIDEVMAIQDTPVEITPVSQLGANQVIVDIRHPDEIELKPLSEHLSPTLEIPFYKVSSEAVNFDKKKIYLLYCDKGVMSQMHATHLIEDGYKNIGVFRPK